MAEPDAEPGKEDNQVLPTDQGDTLEVGPTVIAGEEISGASSVQRDQSVEYVVAIDFNGEGGSTWADITGTAACNPSGDPKRRIAIVLDGEVISSPEVNTDVGCDVGIRGGSTDITGNFTPTEAKDLAALIEGGSLPLELTAISDRLVGPSLGAAAIDASIEAGIIGLVLTGLFIIFVYRFVGLMATIALGSYALLAYAMLVGLGSTLTLPGLAGFVLAIGMAIDANVLVFERAREEYAAYPSAGLRRALQVGFNKAWSAIIDSNVTTLLAAALLFFFGSGPIKGFGVTLSIGVIASMISALIIARVLCDVSVSNKFVERRPALSGIANVGRVRTWLDKAAPDLMKRRVTWLAISGAALVVAIVGIVSQGLNLGVEFTGGRQLDYSVSQTMTIDQAREAVAEAGFPEAVVQTADTADFTVRTGEVSNEEEQRIEAALAEVGGDVTKVDDQRIGASLGQELRDRALIAFGIALLAQLLYLAIRFKWTFGVAAVARDVPRRAARGRPLRLARQADRRHLPGRRDDDRRSLGQRHRRRLRPHPRTLVGLTTRRGLQRDRQQGGRGDHPAHGEHRPGFDVHPRGAGRAGRRLAAGLRHRPARRSDRRYVLLGLHRHPDADLLPGEVADGSGQEGEGRPRGRGLRRRRLSSLRARRTLAPCSGSSSSSSSLVVAYKFRVKLLAKILGQPESRIERQIERKKR